MTRAHLCPSFQEALLFFNCLLLAYPLTGCASSWPDERNTEKKWPSTDIRGGLETKVDHDEHFKRESNDWFEEKRKDWESDKKKFFNEEEPGLDWRWKIIIAIFVIFGIIGAATGAVFFLYLRNRQYQTGGTGTTHSANGQPQAVYTDFASGTTMVHTSIASQPNGAALLNAGPASADHSRGQAVAGHSTGGKQTSSSVLGNRDQDALLQAGQSSTQASGDARSEKQRLMEQEATADHPLPRPVPSAPPPAYDDA